MKAVVVAVLCVWFACAGVVRADLEEGTYAPDIEAKDWLNTEEPVSLQELRGMTVMLFFWVTWHEGGEFVMPMMNLFNSQMGRRQGVYIMGVTDSDRGRVEEMVTEQKVFFPVALESESYEEYEIVSFPRVVIIDPNGRVAWTGWPRSVDALYSVALDLLAEAPPTKTHPEDAKTVRARLARAHTALRDDKYQEAFKAAREAHELALTGDQLKTDCRDVLDLVEALGRDQLAQAERAVDEKDWDRAVDLLTSIRRDFHSLDVARLARRRLEDLKQRIDDVAQIIELENEAQLAENKLGEAMELLRTANRAMNEIGKAHELLEEIVESYSDAPAAAKAQTVLERMRTNVGVMNYVIDYQAKSECELWLSQARSYEKIRRPEKARALYQRIMDTHPDTIWAEIAAHRIQRLP